MKVKFTCLDHGELDVKQVYYEESGTYTRGGLLDHVDDEGMPCWPDEGSSEFDENLDDSYYACGVQVGTFTAGNATYPKYCGKGLQVETSDE